jgi:hypothetical protein
LTRHTSDCRLTLPQWNPGPTRRFGEKNAQINECLPHRHTSNRDCSTITYFPQPRGAHAQANAQEHSDAQARSNAQPHSDAQAHSNAQAHPNAFTVDDLLDVVNVSVADLSDDGRWLAVTVGSLRDRIGIDNHRFGDPTYIAPNAVDIWIIDTQSAKSQKLFLRSGKFEACNGRLMRAGSRY